MVTQLVKSKEFPESVLKIDKLKFKLRVGSFVGHLEEGDHHDGGGRGASVIKRTKHVIRMLFPRPIIVVKGSNIALHVEKGYIAPEVPYEFGMKSNRSSLPSSVIASHRRDPTIPTFDLDSMMEFLQNDEIIEADQVTLCIERWINHVVTKMKGRNDETNSKPMNSRDVPREARTDDERTNALIHSIAEIVCHSLSIHLQNASVIISGASSDYVKETRQKYGARDANLMFAKMPKEKRALTVIGADVISISFSSDEECNGMLLFAGLQVKVGYPVSMRGGEKGGEEDLTYAWHSIAHPFQLVAELKGVIPILTWALNYDHYFENRSIGLDLSASELAVSLSPSHLHTLLLHLDDFTDANSPYNEWFVWMQKRHLQSLRVSEREKWMYAQSYAKLKGVKFDAETSTLDQWMSASQIKDMEKRMTRYEIMSQRCIAMKNEWKIPQGCNDFRDYLHSSRSSILDTPDASRVTPDETLSPFQRVYLTSLHALTTLIREKFSFLSPRITVNYVARTFHFDLPSDVDDFRLTKSHAKRPIPTSISINGVSLILQQTNPLFAYDRKSDSVDRHRDFLKLTLEAQKMEWNVVPTSGREEKLPAFMDGSLVGIVYKVSDSGYSVCVVVFVNRVCSAYFVDVVY